MAMGIEVIDVSALAGPPGPERDAVDRRLGSAAEAMGFLIITGRPVTRVTEAVQIAALVEIFKLPADEKRRLMNRAHEPENENCYRGFFRRPTAGADHGGEGYDMGADRGPEGAADAVEELLMEHNVWPDAALLPGWRALAQARYAEMEHLGQLVMKSLGRYLGAGDVYFERLFGGGVSTQRFLSAPAIPADAGAPAEARYRAVIDGEPCSLITPAHRDSGFMTLLWQPGGLQAQAPDGAWISVPEVPNALNVNFGDCLEFLTGGRLRATPHCVMAGEGDRYSVPFFFEPRLDAMIAPMPGAPEGAAPIRYADHLMAKLKIFGTHATEKKRKVA